MKKLREKVVFLDRDGTLNQDPGYIASPSDYHFFEDTLPSLKRLSGAGYECVVITNQSGVARGKVPLNKLQEIHQYIVSSFKAHGISLLGIYYCPHHPEENCSCRKPGTKLFLEAEKEHGIRLDKCAIIGDTWMDIEAGNLLKMRTLLVRTGRGAETEKKLSDDSRFMVDFVGDNLSQCVDYILDRGDL